MEEKAFRNSVEPFRQMPEPHFDDQSTLLRAQQVVPLREIRAQSRWRKMWFLGGAFVVAMLLGAASALVAVQVKRAEVARAASTVSSDTSEPEVNVEQPAPVVEQASTTLPAVDSETTPVPPKRSLTVRPRIAATNHSTEPITRPRVSEKEDLERIRDAVLFDQWQERRLRRATRRERPRSERDGRDLSHVDEIFEGPRRPERP
jgi:hypothetical protein